LQALAEQADLSERARRRVSATYTWRKTAQGYLSVIEGGIKAVHDRGQAMPRLDAGRLITDHLRHD
jgi:hypothetical protein